MPQNVLWKSSVPAVALVTSTGLVVALASGRSDVIAELAGREARTTIVVQQRTSAPVTAPPANPPAPPPAVLPAPPVPANALVNIDFTKAATRAEALTMLTAASGIISLHSAGSYPDGSPHWAPANPLDLIGFIKGEGLVMLQPKNTSVTPYIRFEKLGARQGIWQMVERRFSPGWTTQGEAERAAGYKIDGVGWEGGNGSARLELTNTSEYTINNGFVPIPGDGGYARTAEVSLRDARHVSGGRVDKEWTGQQAHRFVYFYEAQAKRGTWRVFLDGRQLADATVNYRDVNAPRVNRSSAGMNFNKVRLQDQHIIIRRVIILDSTQHPNPWGLR